MLSFNVFFFNTAHRGGRNNSENYHLRGTEPFHRRDTFNINTLFLPHVSSVPEYKLGRFLTLLNYEKRDLNTSLYANENMHVEYFTNLNFISRLIKSFWTAYGFTV